MQIINMCKLGCLCMYLSVKYIGKHWLRVVKLVILVDMTTSTFLHLNKFVFDTQSSVRE